MKKKSIVFVLFLALVLAVCAPLAACEKKTESYTVTFSAGDVGTDAVTGLPSPQTVEAGGKAAQPESEPVRAGYRFEGWYTAANGGTLFTFANTAINGPTTLYAHWSETQTEKEQYTVTFDAGLVEGTGTVENMPAPQTVTKGGKATKPATDPTREDGYRFLGWFTTSAGGVRFDFAATEITANLTLYAHWQETSPDAADFGAEFYEAENWVYLKQPDGTDDIGQIPYALSDGSLSFFNANQGIRVGDKKNSTVSFLLKATNNWTLRLLANAAANSTSYLQLEKTAEGINVQTSTSNGSWLAVFPATAPYDAGEWNRFDITFSFDEASGVLTAKFFLNEEKVDLRANTALTGVTVMGGNFEYQIPANFTLGEYFLAKVWGGSNVLQLKPVRAESVADVPVVACLGDSITAGAGASNYYTEAYPQQLQQALGGEYHVINFGNSGRTLMSGLVYEGGEGSYWDTEEWKGARLAVPDIAVVMLGSNDSKTKYGITAAAFTEKLEALIGALQAANPDMRIVICTSPTAYPNTFGIDNDLVSDMAVPSQKAVAARQELECVDMNTYTANKRNTFFAADGVHPNTAGYAMLAEIMRRVITGENATPDALAAYAQTFDDPSSSTIETTNDFAPEFYNGANWTKMADDGDSGVQTDNTGIRFYQNNTGYALARKPVDGETVQYSFMLKSDATGSAGWTIRFGVNANNNNGTTYYALGYNYDKLFLQKSGSGAWLTQTSATSYAVNQWNRFDLVIGNDNGALSIALYVNTEQAILTESTALAGVTYEEGRFIDSNPIAFGDYFQVKVWNTDLRLAPVAGTIQPEKIKDGKSLSLDLYDNAQKTISVADYIDENGALNVVYEAASSAESIAAVSAIANGECTVTGLATGSATVTLAAIQGGTARVSITFEITVTDSTPLAYPTEIKQGGEIFFNLSGTTQREITIDQYINPNATQDISYNVVSSDACVTVSAIANGKFTVTGVAEGSAVVTLTGSGGGTTVTIRFAVTVESGDKSAIQRGDIDDMVLGYYAKDTQTVSLADYVDANGTAVTYSANSDDETLVSAVEDGGVLTVRALAPSGTATVTVGVYSDGNLAFTLVFEVTCSDDTITKTNNYDSFLSADRWLHIEGDGNDRPWLDANTNSMILQWGNVYQTIGETNHISFELWVNGGGDYGFEIWFRSTTNSKTVPGSKYIMNGYGESITISREDGAALAVFPRFAAGTFTRFDITMFDVYDAETHVKTIVNVYCNGRKVMLTGNGVVNGSLVDSSPIAAAAGVYFGLKSWAPQIAIRPASALPNPDAIRVAAVGDSITYGHSWHNESYPVFLQSVLGDGYNVGNFGLNGASVTGHGGSGLKYAAQQQYTDSIAFAPDIIVILLGANDANGWANAQASYESELRALIATYQTACPKAKIILATSAPTLADNAFGIPNDVIKNNVNPIQRAIAADLGLPLVDLRNDMEAADGGYTSFFRDDGVHLSVTGAQFTAQSIGNAILALN